MLEDLLLCSPHAPTPKHAGAWTSQDSSPSRSGSPDNTPYANVMMTRWSGDGGSPAQAAEQLQKQQQLQNFQAQVPQHMAVQQMQMQQMQFEQSQQMQQKLMQEEQQLQQQMQQLSAAQPAVQPIPQPAPMPQQYVQQTYSPAVAQAPATVAPEIPTQQMTMPVLQQPELARTCSSGSDISLPPQPPVQYLMHLPAAQTAPAQPAGLVQPAQ